MTPLRVLCIEDDQGAAELIRSHLAEPEYEVTTVFDGESGLAAWHTRPFDVVLIDNLLPDIDGISVIQKLQSKEQFPPPIIMVTGTGDEQAAVEAMKAGANDYLVKDVDGQYLYLLPEVIKQVTEQHELRRVRHEILLEQTQLIKELQAFNYAVAHDLKQPLAFLMSSMGVLRHYIKKKAEAKVDQKMSQMLNMVTKMDTTLDALMLFTKTRDVDDVTLHLIDMQQVVHDVLLQLADVIEQSEATVVIQEELPAALGYLPWVESVWMNYITNAIKYGGKPPYIEIGATHQNEQMVYYWVKDNGPGLTQQEQEKVFLPFSRLQERKAEGHGLGLAIVRLIAKRLGGEASVNSLPGNGSTFGFTLMLNEEASQ